MYWLRFLSFWVFIRTLTIAKIWNSVKLRVSYFVSKQFCVYWHCGKPESLSVEPTNLCNLKCPECPSGNNKMTRPRLFLSLDKFEQLIDQSKKHLINLQLFFQGEPFIHPKVYDFIAYASANNIYTSTSTNGHFLNKENCNRIIDAGLKRLIISMDGTTQATYELYRVGGDLNTVIRGIKNMVEIRSSKGKIYPRIILQFVVFSTNENQLQKIRHLAKQLKVDQLQLKTAQIDDFENGNVLLPKQTSLSRYTKIDNDKFVLRRERNFKCSRIWNGSVLSANGNLLPCCFDKDGLYAYNQNEISDYSREWKSEKAIDFRKKVWDNYEQFTMCNNCTEGIKKHRGMLGV